MTQDKGGRPKAKAPAGFLTGPDAAVLLGFHDNHAFNKARQTSMFPRQIGEHGIVYAKADVDGVNAAVAAFGLSKLNAMRIITKLAAFGHGLHRSRGTLQIIDRRSGRPCYVLPMSFTLRRSA